MLRETRHHCRPLTNLIEEVPTPTGIIQEQLIGGISTSGSKIISNQSDLDTRILNQPKAQPPTPAYHRYKSKSQACMTQYPYNESASLVVIEPRGG